MFVDELIFDKLLTNTFTLYIGKLDTTKDNCRSLFKQCLVSETDLRNVQTQGKFLQLVFWNM